MRKNCSQLIVVFLVGWLGGLAGQWIFPASPALAASRILQADQLWIYAPDGKHRLQMATYSNPGENGLPLIGLSDNETRLRLLLRLAGPNGSPVLIFKDKNGRDRIVLGLNYAGGDEAPFFNYTDEAGASHSLLK